MNDFQIVIDFWLAGGWLLIVPALVVLMMTMIVLVSNAVDRHHARQDGDTIAEQRFTVK